MIAMVHTFNFPFPDSALITVAVGVVVFMTAINVWKFIKRTISPL